MREHDCQKSGIHQAELCECACSTCIATDLNSLAVKLTVVADNEVWPTEEDGDNFVVIVNLPNGNRVRVLIPKDIQDGETYGLNMVTRGHYT